MGLREEYWDYRLKSLKVRCRFISLFGNNVSLLKINLVSQIKSFPHNILVSNTISDYKIFTCVVSGIQ